MNPLPARARAAARPPDASLPLAPSPLPPRTAWPAVGRCVLATSGMLARRRIWQPTEHLGRTLRFADGTESRVYRETRVDRPEPTDPAVLIVAFRLRGVHGAGHTAFERESVLHTPLFAGFPGMVSKLWLAHDDRSVYRGLYEWDGPHLADTYARSLWRVLALVSEPGSIDFRVLAGLSRAALLADPVRTLGLAPLDPDSWWRPIGTDPPKVSPLRGRSRPAARRC
jgi:hypothetical protein